MATATAKAGSAVTGAALAAELRELLASRDEAWDRLGRVRGTLGGMDPIEREAVEKLSRRYWRCDAAITATLVRLGRPVYLGEVTLHLSADALHFIVLDAATGMPHGQHPDQCQGARGLLFDYGAGRARRGR